MCIFAIDFGNGKSAMAKKKKLALDIAKHNSQYCPITVTVFGKTHDRFLCIDNTVYHIGAFLKDLVRQWFAFSKMGIPVDELINRV